MSILDNIATRAKGVAITYPQVYLPGIAGAAVRAITGSSSKGQAKGAEGGQGTAPNARVGHALEVGQPGERYAPALPDNGRTSGILVAQTAAAPAEPAQKLDRMIQPVEED